MRKSIRIAALVAAVLSTILPLSAATPGEFYANLLRRGVAEYDAGRYAEAARHLRIAAFGLVDTIDSYETAHAYLTVAWDKLGQPNRAADSARRVVAAERVQRRYASLALPAGVRKAFEQVASRMLSGAELAALRGTAPLPPAAAQTPRVTTTTKPATTQPATITPPPAQPATTTTTVTQPPVTVDRVDVEVTREPATPPRATNTQTNTQPAATQPRTTTPPPPTTTTNPPRTTTPPVTQPRPATTTPPPAPSTTTARVPATFSAAELATRFAAAERALVTSNLAEARRLYREILESANLSHDNSIRLAEGFYRARDFVNALRAFDRAGTLRRGEEPYRYYIAVASYETAQYARAKRELAAALPFIEITPDVARYRSKIESSVAQ